MVMPARPVAINSPVLAGSYHRASQACSVSFKACHACQSPPNFFFFVEWQMLLGSLFSCRHSAVG